MGRAAKQTSFQPQALKRFRAFLVLVNLGVGMKMILGSSPLTSIHEDAGLIPGFAQ